MSENTIRIDVVGKGNQLRAQRHGVMVTKLNPKSRKITNAPFPKDYIGGSSDKWASWGSKDKLPTEIRQKVEKVPIAGATIYKLIAMMYGNGLAYYDNNQIRNGETKVKRHYNETVEEWLRVNHIREKYLPAQFADYRLYMNTFSELIQSLDEKTITNLYHKPAEFCRLEKQHPQRLDIEFLYYSPDFGSGTTPKANRMKKVPLFIWYKEDEFLEKLRNYKFAWHSRFETPGIIYYAKPFWNGLFREDGWMDAAIAVPEVVNSMMKNQVVLKYQILIPESYFQERFQEWDTYTDDQREDTIKVVIDDINDSLVGTDNAFVSITTIFKQDRVTGADVGKIEIISIDDKLKKDSWVPSSTIADKQIAQGMGQHPSQMGMANEGGKMGAGSGSDQRESFNTVTTLNTIEQIIVLSALNYVAQYNARTNEDWDITFFIDHTMHTTTNDKESGLVESDTTIITE